MAALDPAEVVRRHTEPLMALPGVVGVGEGRIDNHPCVVVLVASPSVAIGAIPHLLDGLPVRVVETGTPEALEHGLDGTPQ
jgi:hypothetical protein